MRPGDETEGAPAQRLSAEDQAILELEGPAVAGHTAKVIVLGPGAPDLGGLRRSVARRLQAAPALERRLSADGGEPAWVPDPAFQIERHILEEEEGPLDPAELADVAAALFEKRLPRDRPLWRLDLRRLRGGGAALIWRLHHALADGTAAMRFARVVLWDETSSEAAAGVGPARPAPAAEQKHEERRRREHLAAFLRREFAPTVHSSPFAGRVGPHRAVGFASLPLSALHDAAHRLAGASLNDAVLSVVGGGLERWLRAAHRPQPAALRLRVPVSLHHEGDDAGNRDSFFTLGVPIGDCDPVQRLRAVHDAEAERKAEHDAEELESFLAGLGRVSTRLERAAERLQASSRSFALSVSNVRGPGDPVSIGGAPVEALYTLAEIGNRHALRVAVVSHGDHLRFGLCVDRELVGDPSALALALRQEGEALLESV